MNCQEVLNLAKTSSSHMLNFNHGMHATPPSFQQGTTFHCQWQERRPSVYHDTEETKITMGSGSRASVNCWPFRETCTLWSPAARGERSRGVSTISPRRSLVRFAGSRRSLPFRSAPEIRTTGQTST